MTELGWKSVGLLELTALPSIPRTVWLPWVEQADVLLVNGGDTIYLDRWMRESGLAELLPSLDLVYVGLSAGSLVMSPAVSDDYFASWTRPVGGEGLGFVDFEIFPHLDNPDLPYNTMADAERWAASLTGPGYAIDDQTAIKVVDGVADRDLGGPLAAVRVVAPRVQVRGSDSDAVVSVGKSSAMGFLKRLLGGAGAGIGSIRRPRILPIRSTSTRPSVPTISSWRARSRTAWTN